MSRVTNLSTDRPRARRPAPPAPGVEGKAETPVVAQENLARAFVTFTQAAGSLDRLLRGLYHSTLRLLCRSLRILAS